MDCFNDLLDEIQAVVVGLERWRSSADPLPWEAGAALNDAYERLDDLRRRLPGAKAWVVMKKYGSRTQDDIDRGVWDDRPWPYMVFPPTDDGRDRAERWARFLTDYYRRPHLRNSETFYVELGAGNRALDHGKPWDRPIGHGYYPEYGRAGDHTLTWRFADGEWTEQVAA